ncbi:MAG TPA: DinB family protein [Nocardioides sp.]|nr:DinB family protein [Nocardioides sp.]
MSEQEAPAVQVEPDTKDWTWVLEQACPECGFDPASVVAGDVAAALRDNAASWDDALTDPRAGQRPAPAVWSPVEYACHVRDVNRIFAERATSMLTEDDPVFANWDQDQTAVAERYDLQQAAEVAAAVLATAEQAASVYDSAAGDAWDRPGRRSNGSVFTVASLASYHLHDVVHHRWDVRHLAHG